MTDSLNEGLYSRVRQIELAQRFRVPECSSIFLLPCSISLSYDLCVSVCVCGTFKEQSTVCIFIELTDREGVAGSKWEGDR